MGRNNTAIPYGEAEKQGIRDHQAGIIDIRPEIGEIWRLMRRKNYRFLPVEPRRADSKNSRGYMTVSVRVNGITRNILSHRLIYCFVNGEIEDGLHIDHINANKSDNRISNLQVLTPSGNAFKKFRDQGTWRGKPLIDHNLVCEMYLSGASWLEIEDATGANSGTVTGILRERGIALRNPRISQDRRMEIIELRQRGFTQKEIAESLGISQASVSLIVSAHRKAS